jgi:hypothetical protein
VLAFTADNVEDVTKTYTLKWETIQQRRLKNRNNAMDFLNFIPKYDSNSIMACQIRSLYRCEMDTVRTKRQVKSPREGVVCGVL